MPSETPLVTVIVPAYNAEQYIAETIRSVIGQTLQEWELIIINDGSTDTTAEIICTFDDERIRLLEQENGGVSAARNRALDEAKGKYITFLDADDIFPPHSLQARAMYMEDHPDIDIVDGKVEIKDPALSKTLRSYQPSYMGKLLPRLVMLDDTVFFGVCYLFKRELLGNIRFKMNMSHCEDLLFYLELSNERDVYYGYVDDVVYIYRSGHGSAMQNLEALEDGYLRLIKEVRTLKNAKLCQQFIMRIKITKIMMLSWLSKKELIKALHSMKLFWLS